MNIVFINIFFIGFIVFVKPRVSLLCYFPLYLSLYEYIYIYIYEL